MNNILNWLKNISILEKDILPHIRTLIFCPSFNQIIPPSVLYNTNLVNIHFGTSFNQQLCPKQFPVTCKNIVLGNNFSKLLDKNIFPQDLETIILDCYNIDKILDENSLPIRLKNLHLYNLNKDIDHYNLPNLQSFSISWPTECSIPDNIQKVIHTIQIDNPQNFKSYPKNIKKVIINRIWGIWDKSQTSVPPVTNIKFKLKDPNTIKHFKYIILPKNLELIEFTLCDENLTKYITRDNFPNKQIYIKVPKSATAQYSHLCDKIINNMGKKVIFLLDNTHVVENISKPNIIKNTDNILGENIVKNTDNVLGKNIVKNINNDTLSNNIQLTHDYIYLLREREFIKTNENIYKIGRTGQCFMARFKQYPKNSKLEMVIGVNNSIVAENVLKKALTKKFIKRKDIGDEYYEGCIKEIKKTVFAICQDYL